jgi:hypothetical protein
MRSAPHTHPCSHAELCFVIGRQRSGTTVFRHMLATHPRVMDLGEIFNEGHPRSYWRFLKTQLREDKDAFYPSKSVHYFLKYLDSLKSENEQKLLVMDVKYDLANSIGTVWRDMNSLPKIFFMMRQNGWTVLDIHRTDLFELIISNFVAMGTAIYHRDLLEEPVGPRPKTYVNTTKLFEEMEGTRLSYERLARHFAGYPRYMKIVYEEMFVQDESLFSPTVVEQVSNLLHLDNLFDVRPKLRRLLSDDVFSYIENATEVRQALKGCTRFAM